jgi:hypothetical protein
MQVSDRSRSAATANVRHDAPVASRRIEHFIREAWYVVAGSIEVSALRVRRRVGQMPKRVAGA